MHAQSLLVSTPLSGIDRPILFQSNPTRILKNNGKLGEKTKTKDSLSTAVVNQYFWLSSAVVSCCQQTKTVVGVVLKVSTADVSYRQNYLSFL